MDLLGLDLLDLQSTDLWGLDIIEIIMAPK